MQQTAINRQAMEKNAQQETNRTYLLDADYANKGRFCNISEVDTLISMWLSVENKAKLSTNKGRFYNNSDIDTLISKQLSVENKAKLS